MNDYSTKAHDDYLEFSEALDNYRYNETVSEWFANFCIKIQAMNVTDNKSEHIKYDDGSYIVLQHISSFNDPIGYFSLVPYDSNNKVTVDGVSLEDYNVALNLYDIDEIISS